jgi:hypothetical protein
MCEKEVNRFSNAIANVKSSLTEPIAVCETHYRALVVISLMRETIVISWIRFGRSTANSGVSSVHIGFLIFIDSVRPETDLHSGPVVNLNMNSAIVS